MPVAVFPAPPQGGPPRAPFPTWIANLALSHIAAVPITELNETSKQALSVARMFWPTTDECLADHDWNFARVYSPPLAEVVVDNFEWDHAFQLPSEPYCLVVRGTDGDIDKEPWVVAGRYIFTDASTIQIRYTARVLDPGQWSPHFVTALSYLLASKLAYPITKSQSVADQMFKVYESRLSRARSNNGLEGPARTVRSSSLTEVR